MKLNADFLTSIPELTYRFVDGTPASRGMFFHALMDIASQDLPLAHSIFKTSAVRTVLDLVCERMSDDSIGAFSVYKPFDTVRLESGKLYGKKHWVTNATIADIAIVQVMTPAGIVLCKTTIPEQRTQFLNSPGMVDTETYDLIYDGETVTELFLKSDSKYSEVSRHNTLAFIANHIGAIDGLMEYMSCDTADLLAEYKNLRVLFREYSMLGTVVIDDAFWHKHNALYLQSKHLLVRTLQRIMEFEAGPFYNVSSAQGKHFFDSLAYSGHNGPIQRNYQQVFTESQDY